MLLTCSFSGETTLAELAFKWGSLWVFATNFVPSEKFLCCKSHLAYLAFVDDPVCVVMTISYMLIKCFMAAKNITTNLTLHWHFQSIVVGHKMICKCSAIR